MAKLTQNFKRVGPDYRFGDQVYFDDIKHTFGFKSINIGSWVTKEEKLIAANLLYDSFADLTQILNIPPTTIGLRETLALAFGTGGQKHVQAYYHSGTRTLAMAKNAGAGALAHEWWHAFDHYICQFLFNGCSSNAFASKQWLSSDAISSHPLNNLLDNFFKLCFLDSTGKKVSEYFSQAAALDETYQQVYFSLPQELTARAFEACIAYSKPIENHYLVSGVKFSSLAKQGGFPTPNLRVQISKEIFQYFNGLGSALHQQLDRPASSNPNSL